MSKHRTTERVCITLNTENLKSYQEKLKKTLTPLSSAINALLEKELLREEK